MIRKPKEKIEEGETDRRGQGKLKYRHWRQGEMRETQEGTRQIDIGDRGK